MPILDINEIRAILPHRYPFLLVDRIVEMEADRIVGIKNVTANEPHFTGHFPDFPVMPGVLIVEAMAQTAGVLVLHNMPDRDNKLVLLVAIENARFRRPVVPGDTLRMEMKILKRKASVAKMAGVATVDGVVVAEAEVMCKLADKEEKRQPKQSSLSDADSPHRHRRPHARKSLPAPTSAPTASSARKCRSAPRTRLMANNYLEGPTWIGEDNIFFPYTTVGVASQDLKYKGERAETRIGHRNRIREFVTIHRGTAGRRTAHLHRQRQPAHGLRPHRPRCPRSAITSSWPTASPSPATSPSAIGPTSAPSPASTSSAASAATPSSAPTAW